MDAARSAPAGAQDPNRRLLQAAVHLRTANIKRALREGADPETLLAAGTRIDAKLTSQA